MARNHVATALGFCIDHPLVIHLTFGSTTWSAKEASESVDFFRCVEVFVKENPAQVVQMGVSIEKVVGILDEKIKNDITNSCSSTGRMWQYGPRVLVRKFVKEFFHCCQVGNNRRLYVMGRVAESDNIFVALFIFLGTWLKNLRNWCVVCRKQIPQVSRLWYCQSELCLYRFEELGIGASVLQELQNSELIDLELTLAAAATRSAIRDVFEPYPTFLLKKQEIRKRSGFFSNKAIKSGKDTSNEAGDYLVNKNLDLIMQLIDSFPPLSEMQQCSNEIELVLRLGMSWLQNDCNPGSINKKGLSQEEYAQIIWLPYKILRYVLFTNRLSLCLLQDSRRLDLHGLLYQFAVFYNAESEQKFEQLRKTQGSVFAFHGSSLSNWYSIIRNGLRCLSKTRYMSTGNVLGDGIYFSTNITVSLRYSNSIPWMIHGKTKEYRVLALCEIFSRKKHCTADNYVVVPPKNEEDIAIRYLLVFEGEEKDLGNVSVTKKPYVVRKH